MNKSPYNRLYRALQAQYEMLDTVDTETTNVGTSKNTGTQTNVGDTTTDSDGGDSVQNKMNALDIVRLLKDFRVKVKSVRDKEYAQVCKGGLLLSETDPSQAYDSDHCLRDIQAAPS